METVLLMATVYLLAATLFVPLAVRLGFGSVLGYLVAGVAIGPVTGLVGSETVELQHFAEFGVVMMLFLIGLELDPRTLWDMRRRLLGLGAGQVAATVAAVAGLGWALGAGAELALGAGMILALSSTAIVMQTLQEKRLDGTPGGRSAFSVLLAQDIAVIPMLALLPLLGGAVAATGDGHGGGGHGGGGHGAPAMGDGASAAMADGILARVETLPGWGYALLTVAAVGAVVLGGRFLTRPVFAWAARARLREMFTIVSLLFVVAVAELMMLVGLSPALGTFLAGVVLANSEYRHELEADIAPFKGLLLGLFFITVGAGIDFGTLAAQPGLIAGLVAGTIAVKGAILFALGTAAGLRGTDRTLFALSLAQAGEFGFVLASVALTQGVFGAEAGAVLLLVVALTMLITPLLFVLHDALVRGAPAAADPEPDAIEEHADVIVAGVGRFGQVVHRLLQSAGERTVVLDRDHETIALLRGFGLRTYMGDPTRPELLEAAGIAKARIVVVALDDRADAVRLVALAKELNPAVHVIARAYDRVHVYELYRAGADQIVREMFDGSLRAGRYALERLGWSDTEAHRAREAFFKRDREMVRELAGLWKPGVPLKDNPAYAERARAYNQEMESALLARFGEDEAAAEAARAAEPRPDAAE